MSQEKRLCYSYHPKSKDSSDSTKKSAAESVIIDITAAVRKFMNAVDSQVDNLGYDVRGIILEYSAYRDGVGDEIDSTPLAFQFYRNMLVEDEQDARTIAELAVKILYPRITSQIRELGYIAGAITHVSYKNVRRTNSLHCQVVMMVV